MAFPTVMATGYPGNEAEEKTVTRRFLSDPALSDQP